ncbi:MAG: hypothetical protein KBC02_01750 [Candidatus Pacebacteria bacterium]|nr:hypothetical protein [Candidatus Paceibacterota bacterium]
MNFRKASSIILLLLIIIWPQPAHAFGEGAMATVLSVFNAVIEIIQAAIVKLLITSGQLLQDVIHLEMSYGGAAVYMVWKIFRDICNSLFIIFFIIIAFSTIFNSIAPKGLKPYFWKEALTNVILAAILINFSLPIGQAMIWAGNASGSYILKAIGVGDFGKKIAENLNFAAVIAGTSAQQYPTVSVDFPESSNLSAANLTGIQSWVAASQYDTALGQAARAAIPVMKKCLEANRPPVECYNEGVAMHKNELIVAADKDAKAKAAAEKAQAEQASCELMAIKNGGTIQCGTKVVDAPESILMDAGQYARFYTSMILDGKWSITAPSGPNDLQGQVNLFLSNILGLIMMLAIVLSFSSIIIFQVARIPAGWFLLSTSAMAFFSIAMPGSTLFGKWRDNMIGWALFTPLYLFVIYIGLFVLEQRGTLLASMSGAQMPFFMGQLGIVLFYFITAFIFMGGAQWARETAFGYSKMAGTAFGAIASRIGVDEKSNFGLTTAASGLAKYSGAQGAYESVKATGEARIAKMKQGISDSTFLAMPSYLQSKTYEEKLAEKQSAMGVYGADKAVQDLTAKKVSAEQTRLKTATSQMNDAQKSMYLQRQASSANRSIAIAAREMLVERNDPFMTPAEIARTKNLYPNEGAKKAFDDKVKNSARNALREKKKKDQEKRQEVKDGILASVESLPAVTPVKIGELLDPYFRPAAGATPDRGEQAAYLEALSMKDPVLVFDYLQRLPAPGARATDLARAFAPILKKPENIFDLPEAFMNNAANLPILQEALDVTYPAGKKRARAKDRLLTSRPDMTDVINRDIFP